MTIENLLVKWEPILNHKYGPKFNNDLDKVRFVSLLEDFDNFNPRCMDAWDNYSKSIITCIVVRLHNNGVLHKIDGIGWLFRDFIDFKNTCGLKREDFYYGMSYEAEVFSQYEPYIIKKLSNAQKT